MKKILLLSLLLVSTFFVQAQIKTDSLAKRMGQNGKNEIKINLLSSILGLPEINYERLLSDNMGIGLALNIGLGDEEEFSEYRFLAVPHYRIYFGKKNAVGFFIEANAAIGNVRERQIDRYYDYSGIYYQENFDTARLNFGLGAAVGAKFLTHNGFIGEIYGGVGRFLGENRSIEAYPRIGIVIGKRF